ncbi:DUF748 domain-containing protein [Endozoicomonas numazuensis]|uniref:Uncharacterized protein n=1 Tax=Endozoicomonas numazuensis TaxID=1137799 RepID=A0A081NE52_9GAMM|nr:hypothetical protein [Endozoicomonas numazuensis]KEQ16725.1 hypothetical protein GZ78_18705 [Endozoicomonas numazuensis]
MQTQQSVIRFVIFAVIVLAILLSLISVVLMVPGRYTDQLLQQIEDQTGVEVLPVAKEYSFITGKFLLTNPELRISPGITLKSESIGLNVAWTSLWKDKIELDQIDFKNPRIFLDLGLIGQKPPMPNLYQFLRESGRFVFEDGSMKVVNTEQASATEIVGIDFNRMELKTQQADQVAVEVFRDSGSRKWSLGGIVDLNELMMSGQLSIDELPLADAVNQGFIQCSECSLEGRLSTDLSVEWSIDQGWELTGTAKVLDGQFQDLNTDLDLKWKELFAEGFQFKNNEGFVDDLSFKEAGLTVNGNLLQQVAKSLDSSLPVAVKNIEFNGVIQSSERQDKALFSQSRVELELLGPGQFTYQLNGQWLERVAVFLEGGVDSNNTIASTLNISARDVDLSLLSASERSVAGYDLAGSRVNLNLASTAGGGSRGKLIFSKLEAKPIKPELDIKHVKALMTNIQSIMAMDVFVRGGQSPLAATKMAIQSTWKRVLDQPLQYLSQQAGITPALSNNLHMPAGRAYLTDNDKAQLKGWSRVLTQRPDINISVQAVASKEKDWPILSRSELEADLIELYSAINRSKPGEVKEIPADIRGQLIEQMYLRAHNRKIPEVGDVSQGTRVKEAEQWLLKNWPANQEKMNKLAVDRLNAVNEYIVSEGTGKKRIISLPPSTVENAKSAVEIQLLY